MRQISQRIALIGHGFELNDLENLIIFTGVFLKEERASTFVGEMGKDSDKYLKPADAEQGYA